MNKEIFGELANILTWGYIVALADPLGQKLQLAAKTKMTPHDYVVSLFQSLGLPIPSDEQMEGIAKTIYRVAPGEHVFVQMWGEERGRKLFKAMKS